MEKRAIAEYMSSGECKSFVLDGNQQFKQLEDGSATGFFTRIDENGNFFGYKAVNQDIEWKAFVNTDVIIGDTETFIISLTIDHSVTAENGSYAFSCKVKNGSSNKAENVTFVVRDEGDNAIASKMVSIDKGEEAFPATFYGDFINDHDSGSEFKVYAYGSNNSIARGTLTPIGLKVVEAQAAPITMNSLNGFDFTKLPEDNPHIEGRLYIGNRNQLKVSRG